MRPGADDTTSIQNGQEVSVSINLYILVASCQRLAAPSITSLQESAKPKDPLHSSASSGSHGN
ncbi:Uncharacterized protein OBRU01_07520 [Operophtera brumata]|uniref:Uncharacterized protein n=1 Tax=Operophtera brumata TaxID=104452 RepID=A0A0L7LJ89_OPEBR|nr:Uncharacterized protein OBRU01_07520 [Operophtera brumata]